MKSENAFLYFILVKTTIELILLITGLVPFIPLLIASLLMTGSFIAGNIAGLIDEDMR